MLRTTIIFLTIYFSCSLGVTQNYKIGLLKYNGGGDWYSNPTALTNLIVFCNESTGSNIHTKYDEIDISSPELFNYPWVHLTGHGNVVFSEEEVINLKNYLIAGGFLHISDNYGLDPFIRKEIKKLFPNLDFVELPHDHPIYNEIYDFPNGLPKIHEHDNKTPLGLGIVYEGRLVCFYDHECDLSDGWEDQDVHNDSEETRLKALKMGVNILSYSFLGKYD